MNAGLRASHSDVDQNAHGDVLVTTLNPHPSIIYNLSLYLLNLREAEEVISSALQTRCFAPTTSAFHVVDEGVTL